MFAEAPAPIRRFLRFLALPYCYVVYINWKECKATPMQVVIDFLYIFFRLKYFPVNYSYCRLWEKEKSQWKFYYGSVYDSLQRSRLRKEVFPYKYRVIYDDKSLTQKLCEANGLPVPLLLGVVAPGDCREFLVSLFKKYPNSKFIIKAIAGRGGKDIFLTFIEGGKIVVKGHNSLCEGVDSFSLPCRSIIQEFVHQHSRLNLVSPSVNTVRIVTMLTKSGDFLVIGAFMRFGVGGAFLDNTSQGGVTAGIQIDSGCLMKYAYDFNSMRYVAHPSSGFKFEGFLVPLWKEVLEVAEQTHRAISYNKLIGQDIAITENGPVIIELNAEYDNVGLEQVCGPILKNKRVLEEFDRYDLLISKLQRSLL